MKPLKDATTGNAIVPSGAQVVQVVAQDQSMILLRLYLGEKEVDCLLPPDMARKIGESLIGEADDMESRGTN